MVGDSGVLLPRQRRQAINAVALPRKEKFQGPTSLLVVERSMLAS